MNRIIEILILIIISIYYLSLLININYDKVEINFRYIAYSAYVILWIIPAILIFLKKKYILYIPLIIFCTILYFVSRNLIVEHYVEGKKEYQEKKEIVKNLHYNRNKYNINLPFSIKEAKELGWYEPEFDIQIFKSKLLGSFFHQDFSTISFERKFVSPDGHREIIFTSDGKIVNDDAYIGTYNFFPISDKENHKKYDVDPYLEFGNTKKDYRWFMYIYNILKII